MNNDTLEIARTILAQNERLLALMEADAPAKVTRPKAEPKARRTAKPQVKAAKAPKVTCLTKDTRKAFIKAHEWAQDGMSTQCLASMAVIEGLPLAKGWAIGEGYRRMFA
jgi:hypothetical protein